MTEMLAYFNGQYVPASQLVIGAEDIGFVQGVSIAERLRTFQGHVFRLDDHLERLHNSLRVIELDPGLTMARIGELIQETVARNRPLLESGDDMGISLILTPGTAAERQPTVAIKTYPLPFGQWASYYDVGQALTETGVRQVPPSCWPSSLKCRSRMHYYLADQRAQRRDPGSRAILLDQDGVVSEASTANVLYYRRDVGLVSPPLDRILPGVSLSVLAELAQSLSIPFCFRAFSLVDLESADEILLCSTSPCVWPVTRLNSRAIASGSAGAIYRQILAAWSELVGLDIVGQARRFGHRK